MKLNTLIDGITWFFVFYWIQYRPFTIETHPLLAYITIGVLVWKWVPYLIQDEFA